jgi:HK97 family phage prohead protease
MLKKYGASLFRNGPLFAKSAHYAEPPADREPNFCIEGLGVSFETLIINKDGETIWFEPGAFDNYFASGRQPEMWLGHDKNRVVGSNVELCVLDEGIAFRFQLPDTAYGKAVKDMVLSGEQTSISVGFTQLSIRNEVHFGHNVIHILEAEIREVSLCPRGACKKAFARLIDANHEPPLHESVNSAMFGIEYDIHNLRVGRADIGADIRMLKKTLSTLEAGTYHGEPQVVTRSMTAAQSNRLQTEWYARLQHERRAMLGM